MPTLVLDESQGPQRLARDRWDLTRAELVRLVAALVVLLVVFSLAAFLVWRRLRLRPLLTPIPHRTRPVPAATPRA